MPLQPFHVPHNVHSNVMRLRARDQQIEFTENAKSTFLSACNPAFMVRKRVSDASAKVLLSIWNNSAATVQTGLASNA